MTRIFNFLKKMFSKNKKVETLFPENKKVVLAELGGNYCQDGC